MKRIYNLFISCFIFLSLFLHFSSTYLLAAENGNSWRPVYDDVLMWINFGIILFLIIKFVKKPLLDFLQGCKNDISTEIDELDQKKEKTIAEIEETNKKIEKSNIQLVELKEKIIKQGKNEKLKIIKKADEQSAIMLNSAKQKADNYIKEAKRTFRSELIDAAFNMAKKTIPEKIIQEDNEQLLKDYISSIPEKT